MGAQSCQCLFSQENCKCPKAVISCHRCLLQEQPRSVVTISCDIVMSLGLLVTPMGRAEGFPFSAWHLRGKTPCEEPGRQTKRLTKMDQWPDAILSSFQGSGVFLGSNVAKLQISPTSGSSDEFCLAFSLERPTEGKMRNQKVGMALGWGHEIQTPETVQHCWFFHAIWSVQVIFRLNPSAAGWDWVKERREKERNASC